MKKYGPLPVSLLVLFKTVKKCSIKIADDYIRTRVPCLCTVLELIKTVHSLKDVSQKDVVVPLKMTPKSAIVSYLDYV